MDLSTLLNSRRSIRKFKPGEIPQSLFDQVLSDAIHTSSSGNMQPYSILVTRDLKIREQLFKPHFEQKMLLQASALVTFCSDFHRMREWLRLSEAPDNFDNFMSYMIGAIDCVLAAQSAALGFEAHGLGICFMGTTLASCDEIAKILKLPPQVAPITGFVVGYPDEDPAPRDRLPASGLIHYDTYQDFSEQRVREIYRERETKGWERYMSFPELRESILKSGVKNLAQIYTELKYTRASHEEYSRRIWNCLQTQGFLAGLDSVTSRKDI